ncbi:MAG: hypothetical protein QGI83_05640 [Candidatus Latescibacteria bacterium]|nr:hypothetical protein [Candidatus Latescibacterota bacterium]
MDFINSGQKIEVAVGTEANPRVLRWTTWRGRRNDLRVSYLLVTDDGGIVIDPLKLPREGLDHLRGFVDGFAAVVLTCANHDRDARWFGNQVKAPVLAPEGSPARAHKSVKRTYGDEQLLGGVRAVASGKRDGEMGLFWPQGRRRLLFCGDTIYGQTESDGLAGYPPKWWMQTDGIRLYMSGQQSKSQMRERYSVVVDMAPTEVFNGHNPRPISDASTAIAEVLKTGKLEVIKGAGTYLWRRWPE